MSETKKTIGFLAGTAVLAGLSAWTISINRPPVNDDSEFGKPLFSALENEEGEMAEIESLEIIARDDDGELQEFIVEKKNGLWTIPSHYNYPAEAAERLARATTALTGLKRQTVDGRARDDHEKRGVLDPVESDSASGDAIGKRIILKGVGDAVLADLIIGKPAGSFSEGPEDRAFGDSRKQDLFFARAASETRVYRLPLELELSTRFSDWINTDLLDFGDGSPVRLEADNYRVVEEKGPLGQLLGLSLVPGEKVRVTREDPVAPWTVEGIDEGEFETNVPEVNKVTRLVDDLEIRGVRPKFTFNGKQLLTADLELNIDDDVRKAGPEAFQQAVNRLRMELSERGFNLAGDDAGKTILVAEQGQFSLGCDDGVVYTLYFGKSIVGDEKTIEIGSGNSEIETEDQAVSGVNDGTGEEAAATNEPDGPDDKSELGGSSGNTSRFVMIRVTKDESLLGQRPVAPTAPAEPSRPEGYVPARESGEDTETGEQESSDDRDPAFIEYDRLMKEYEIAKSEYETELGRFEFEKGEFENRLKAAETRVKELNDRFGLWYYVVSAANLEQVGLKKENVVKPLVSKDASGTVELPEIPNIDFEMPPAAGIQDSGN